jgi:hypothetical protein
VEGVAATTVVHNMLTQENKIWIRELTGLRPTAISAQVILMVLVFDEGAVLLSVPGLKWRPAEEDVFETLW